MHWMLLKPPSALHLCLLFQDALGERRDHHTVKNVICFLSSFSSMQLLSFGQTSSCQEIY